MSEDAPIPFFTIIPAQPDWFVGTFIPGGMDGTETWIARFEYEPIIAWKIEHARYDRAARRPEHERCNHVNPITINGDMNHIGNPWVIKRPDGKFESVSDTTFNTEAEALEYFQREADEDEAREKRKKQEASA